MEFVDAEHTGDIDVIGSGQTPAISLKEAPPDRCRTASTIDSISDVGICLAICRYPSPKFMRKKSAICAYISMVCATIQVF